MSWDRRAREGALGHPAKEQPLKKINLALLGLAAAVVLAQSSAQAAAVPIAGTQVLGLAPITETVQYHHHHRPRHHHH